MAENWIIFSTYYFFSLKVTQKRTSLVYIVTIHQEKTLKKHRAGLLLLYKTKIGLKYINPKRHI